MPALVGVNERFLDVDLPAVEMVRLAVPLPIVADIRPTSTHLRLGARSANCWDAARYASSPALGQHHDQQMHKIASAPRRKWRRRSGHFRHDRSGTANLTIFNSGRSTSTKSLR